MNGSSRQTPSTRATVAAIGSILLWCWSGVCFRKGAEAIGAMPYLAFMTGGGSLTVIALQLLQRRPLSDLYRLPVRVIVAGFFGVAFYTVILSAAIGMAAERDVGQVSLINYLWPMWIVLLGMFFLGERPAPMLTLAGALLGFAGVAISRGMETFTRSPSSLLPHALALVGGFSWAVYSVLLRRWRIPEEKGGTAFHFAVCAIMAAVIAAAKGQWRAMPAWTPSTVFWILFGAIGPVGLGYHWWEIGVKRGAVQLLAALSYFIPIGAALLIGFFFREAMSLGLVPGAAMIAAGAWLVRRATRQAEKNEK